MSDELEWENEDNNVGVKRERKSKMARGCFYKAAAKVIKNLKGRCRPTQIAISMAAEMERRGDSESK